MLFITLALYFVAWGQDGLWLWACPIALFYLAPIALAALYLGWRPTLVVAGVAVLALLPLAWRGWQFGYAWNSLVGLGAVALVLLAWTVLLGRVAGQRSPVEAIQEARLVESATLRVRHLATLNEIGRAVISSLDLDTTLALIMDKVQDALDAESGSLMLIENRRLVFHTSFGPVGERIRPYKLELGQGIAGWVALTGESILVVDAKRDARHFAEFDRTLAYETRSILCVPLKGADSPAVGVLEVINPRQRQSFTKQDRELLESIATFAVTAIQNARLYQQTLRHVTDLYALYEVGKGVTSTLDIDSMMQKLAAETIRLTGAARSRIALVDPQTRQVSALVQQGYSDSPPATDYDQFCQGLSGWVLEEKTSTLSDNLRRDERMRGVDVERIAGAGARSMMAAPFLVQGEPVGVLCAVRLDDTAPFTDRELGVLNMLAGQASIAIENAHNFEERKRRIVELSILNQTGQALSSTLEKDDLIELIYHQVARVMDAQNFYIALYDAERDTIRFPIAYEHGQCRSGPGLSPTSDEWLPRRGRSGLTEHIIRTKQALWLPNRVIERMAELGVEQIGLPSLSWLGVPILWEDEPLGAIAVQSFERENAYDEGHRELLTTIASQAAVAMRNVELFEQVSQMTENLETLVADRTEALAQANRELTVERDRLNALYRIMRELSGSLELERLMNRTLLLINHVLSAEQGYILLRDTGKTLAYRAVVGRTAHTPDGEPFPAPRMGETVTYRDDQGLIGRVMSRPHTVLINDLAAAPHWEILPGQARWHRSVLAAPLLSGEETRGCILLYHRAPDHFTGDHQRMLDAIASQIAVTVSSIEIFDLLTESADRLGTMLRLQQLESAKSQAILEGVADGVLVIDAGGRIILLNSAAERILHMSRDAVVGSSESELAGLFSLTGTTWAELTQSWAQSHPDPDHEALYEERIEFEEQVISIRIAPVYRQGMFEGTVSVFRDISQEVEVDRIKSEFVSMVSHELRTPMTSIKGYIDLLYSGMAGPITDPQKGFLQTVKNNADRLTVLVNSLLDISRLDTGVIRLNLASVNPLEVITNVIAELQPRLNEREQTVHVLATPPLPRVRADPERVVQILANLVDNAVKYTPHGGQVTLDAQEMEGFLHLHVTDTGIGISQEDQEKLFSRFFRAESALSSGVGGVGLGLYITRSLVELHGGEIWVSSNLDQGSTFSFSLPLAVQHPEMGDDHPFQTISYRSQDRHILVIEDEVQVAERIVHHLRGLGGYRVYVARQGRAALQYVEESENRIDLIALDLHLPDMDGYDLIGRLKAESATRDVPVIAIARGSVDTAGERQRTLELGVVQFLNKPLKVPELVAAIQRALPERAEVPVEEAR
jgi:signal transduction histidine kinase/ActR/RegA family two-component response regulator/putative methionine-R-sulfoxide reductase with GAF domain